MATITRQLSTVATSLALLSGVAVTAYGGGLVKLEFNAGNFPGAVSIDNPYWPLPAGRTFVYRTVAKAGCEVNRVEVTGVTPLIDGVLTRQVHDQVWEDDNCDGVGDFLSEDTLDWYAQDKAGNIWYFGEDSKDFCDRSHPDLVCSTEGSWQAGVDGALPGVIILAAPAVGDFYQQEFAEGAQDMGKVLRTNAEVTLAFQNTLDTDRYSGCLETKEWSPLEHGAIEHKYYCKGAGFVLGIEFHGGTQRTELIEVIGP